MYVLVRGAHGVYGEYHRDGDSFQTRHHHRDRDFDNAGENWLQLREFRCFRQGYRGFQSHRHRAVNEFVRPRLWIFGPRDRYAGCRQ